MKIEVLYKNRMKPILIKLQELLIRLIFLDYKDLFSDQLKGNLLLFQMNLRF